MLDDRQVHIRLLELMGWDAATGIPIVPPPLDHNLIWEAEEKLLTTEDEWDDYESWISESMPTGRTKHAPAIVCARAILKVKGISNE
ncbi:MAG: hypothetical protein EHM79_00240 [Geobacter sp.]|nr:MAG: hypothetical protein EHM79_00240 [Geobacter sp.]